MTGTPRIRPADETAMPVLLPVLLRRIATRAGSKLLITVTLCLLTACTSPAHLTAQPAPPMPDHAKLWQAYANHFISSDGRVIDPMNGDWTTSEGQSYALFFALVNNDRARFDKLHTWTEANLAANDLSSHLPAWSWGKSKEGNWGILDPHSASDSDLWIAYDLVEAGRLWNDLHYATQGRRLAALIARKEISTIPNFGPVLMPSSTGFKSDRAWVLNPSYTPLFLLDRMAMVDPAAQWADVAAMYPALIERSTKNGFAMNWVSYTPGEGFTPCLVSGKKDATALGSYDAIRVYTWAGMLPDSNHGKARLLKALTGMNMYMAQHVAPPEKINSAGNPQGPDGPVGFSAALVPYLKGVMNEPAAAQQLVRIKSQLDEKSNLYNSGLPTGPAYYDQNLILFGSGWLQKSFQFGSSGELLVRWTR